METDLIDEQIKAVNKKVIRLSLFGSLLVGIISCPFGPNSDWFFLIDCFFICALISFCLFYKVLFYCFGKHLVAEAQKRGNYFLKPGEGFSEEDFLYNPLFRDRIGNVHDDSLPELRRRD